MRPLELSRWRFPTELPLFLADRPRAHRRRPARPPAPRRCAAGQSRTLAGSARRAPQHRARRLPTSWSAEGWIGDAPGGRHLRLAPRCPTPSRAASPRHARRHAGRVGFELGRAPDRDDFAPPLPQGRARARRRPARRAPACRRRRWRAPTAAPSARTARRCSTTATPRGHVRLRARARRPCSRRRAACAADERR